MGTGESRGETTKTCTECGLSVKSEAAVCEHCGNVFRKTENGQNDEEDCHDE